MQGQPATRSRARSTSSILSKTPPIVEESTPWRRLRLRLRWRAVIPGALPPRIAHHGWRRWKIARAVIEPGGAPAVVLLPHCIANIGISGRNQAVSGIHSLATAAASEIFDESPSAAFNRIARTKIDLTGD